VKLDNCCACNDNDEDAHVVAAAGAAWCLQSRPVYSLLGYCYYQLERYVEAADCYEQLTILHPDVEDFKLYYAQSLYKASLLDEAMKVSSQIDNPAYWPQVPSLSTTSVRPMMHRSNDLSTLLTSTLNSTVLL